MNFNQEEEIRIQEDEKDNQMLARIVKEYEELKKKYSNAQNQIASLTAEIVKLKDTNKILQDSKSRNIFYSKEQPLLFNDYPNYSPFTQHPNSYFNVQQTKRKVINGFVAELTHQL